MKVRKISTTIETSKPFKLIVGYHGTRVELFFIDSLLKIFQFGQ